MSLIVVPFIQFTLSDIKNVPSQIEACDSFDRAEMLIYNDQSFYLTFLMALFQIKK